MDNNLSTINWKDCVNGIKEGDKQAFEFLYLKTYGSLKKRILFKTRFNEQDAEDILQETYIRAYKGIDQLSEPNAVLTWLQTICDRLCLNAIEKNDRRNAIASVQLESDIASEDEDVDSFSLDMIEAPDNIEKEIDQKEVQRLLAEIISELPPLQCSCLQMQMDNRSIKEIMEETGLPEGTVKTYLFKAKKYIKAKVEELEKQGTKLWGLAPLPFFGVLYKLFISGAEETPANYAQAVAGIMGNNAVTEAVAAQGIRAAAVKTGAEVTGAGASATAGVSATLGVGKIIAIAAAAIIVAGGITAGVIAGTHSSKPEPTVAAQEIIESETGIMETTAEEIETTTEQIKEIDKTLMSDDTRLNEFLYKFTRFYRGEYDHENTEDKQNVMWYMLGETLPCIDWVIYPLTAEDNVEAETDLKISENSFNWVASNIFHVDDGSIESFKQSLISGERTLNSQNERHFNTYSDGYYETSRFGLGGFPSEMVKIDSIILDMDEDIYNVHFYHIFEPGSDDYSVTAWNAKMQLKEIDDYYYWTLYSIKRDNDTSGLDRLIDEAKTDLMSLLQGVWREVEKEDSTYISVDNDRIIKYDLSSGTNNADTSEIAINYVEKMTSLDKELIRFFFNRRSYAIFLENPNEIKSFSMRYEARLDRNIALISSESLAYEKYDGTINELLGIDQIDPEADISADTAGSYLNLLSQKETSIRKASEEIENVRSKDNVSFCDVNNDGVPEMFCLEYDGPFMDQEGDYYKISVHIYSYSDGTINELNTNTSVRETNDQNIIDYFILTDYFSQERMHSVIYFKINGSDEVYSCKTESPGMTIEWMEVINSDLSTETVATANLRFGRDDTIESSLNNMSEIILIGDPSGQFDDYDAPLSSMTYDEAVEYLNSMK